MRYTSSQYAQGLYDALKESSNKHATVKKFVELLVRHGRLSKIRSIMLDFAELVDKESGKEKVEIVSAKPSKAAHAVQKSLGENADVEEKIDPSIMAGMRIRVGDELVDNTIRKRLADLRHAIAN